MCQHFGEPLWIANLILHVIVSLKHGIMAAGVGFHHCLTVFEMLLFAAKLEIDMYNIQSMKILVPPTKVISDFQKKMNALDEQIEANTMEIQKLNELRSVLLARLSD